MLDCVTELDCRLLYSEIIGGRTECEGGFFIKHYNDLDISKSESRRRQFLKEAESQGLLSEKDKLTLLAKNGHWTEAEEKSYISKQEEIDSLRFSLKKLVIPQQIEHMKGMIKEKENDIYDQAVLRIALLGTTSESYASKRATELHILNSFYRDEALKVPYFNQDEIDDISNMDIDKFGVIYNDAHSGFKEKNFKKIAVCPFAMNAYISSNDNPYYLFGQPLVYLTIYQTSLLHKMRFYKNIITHDDCKMPPEEYYDDLNNIVKFYDQQYSIMLGKKNQEKNK